jgi:hypothetical protein
MEDYMGTNQPKPASAPLRTIALWAGLFLAPAAWAVHLQFVYAASQQVCKQSLSSATLSCASAICLALAIISGLLATWNWFVAGAKWPSGEQSDLMARCRFLSAEGMLSALLFAVVIAAQWLALVYLPPCP